MNHKYIFLTWLLANIILSLIVLLYSLLSGDSSDFYFSLQAILIGFVISIPSLIVLEVAVFDYKKKRDIISFKKYFSKKILLVNLFYFLCSCLFLSSKQYFFIIRGVFLFGIILQYFHICRFSISLVGNEKVS